MSLGLNLIFCQWLDIYKYIYMIYSIHKKQNMIINYNR